MTAEENAPFQNCIPAVDMVGALAVCTYASEHWSGHSNAQEAKVMPLQSSRFQTMCDPWKDHAEAGDGVGGAAGQLSLQPEQVYLEKKILHHKEEMLKALGVGLISFAHRKEAGQGCSLISRAPAAGILGFESQPCHLLVGGRSPITQSCLTWSSLSARCEFW